MKRLLSISSFRDMKTFIRTVPVFLLFSACWYVILVCVWGDFAPKQVDANLNFPLGGYGHSLSRFREAENYGDVDILFLGSSHAYRGFDTRIFESEGYQSFNLGSGAQTHVQTELLLNRYFDRLMPEIVVYEVYPGSFGLDGIESSLDLLANTQLDAGLLKIGLKQSHVKIYNTIIYSFYKDITGTKQKFAEVSEKGPDEYISGGFVQRKTGHFSGDKTTHKYWIYRHEQIEAFKRNIAYLDSKQVRVILVQAPVTKFHYKSYQNYPLFDQAISGEGEYYNFNERMSLDDSIHFYDQHHMNQSGIELFNRDFIKQILSDSSGIKYE
jgi:hypothetical protein